MHKDQSKANVKDTNGKVKQTTSGMKDDRNHESRGKADQKFEKSQVRKSANAQSSGRS